MCLLQGVRGARLGTTPAIALNILSGLHQRAFVDSTSSGCRLVLEPSLVDDMRE